MPQPVVVSVTAAGITGGKPRLWTAAERTITEHSYGIAPTEPDVKTGTAANNYSAYIAFDFPSLFVVLEAKDNSFEIEFSDNGGVTWKDTKTVDVAVPLILPLTATGFRIRNAVAHAVSNYEVTSLGTGY